MKVLFTNLILLLWTAPLIPAALGYDFPDDDGVDYAACLEELDAADADRDGALRIDEYRAFVRAYEGRVLCGSHLEADPAASSIEHDNAFHSIACMCRCREGRACCEGDKARIDAGAGAGDPDRTCRQHYYLTTVCQVTDGSILEPRCSELSADGATVSSPEEEQAIAAALSKSTAGEGDSGKKVKGGLLAAIVVAASVLSLGVGCYFFARCFFPRTRPQKEQQPQAQSADEKEQESDGGDDDATEVSEDA